MIHSFFQDVLGPFTDIDAFIAALEDSNNQQGPINGTNVPSWATATFQVGGSNHCDGNELRTDAQSWFHKNGTARACEALHEDGPWESSKSRDFDLDEVLQELDASGEMFPSVADVIFGKGGRSKHPGNAPLALANPTRKVRQEIVLELVGFVLQRGGRFLVEDRNMKGAWKRAGFDLACKKARQLLFDTTKRLKKEKKTGYSRSALVTQGSPNPQSLQLVATCTV